MHSCTMDKKRNEFPKDKSSTEHEHSRWHQFVRYSCTSPPQEQCHIKVTASGRWPWVIRSNLTSPPTALHLLTSCLRFQNISSASISCIREWQNLLAFPTSETSSATSSELGCSAVWERAVLISSVTDDFRFLVELLRSVGKSSVIEPFCRLWLDSDLAEFKTSLPVATLRAESTFWGIGETAVKKSTNVNFNLHRCI